MKLLRIRPDKKGPAMQSSRRKFATPNSPAVKASVREILLQIYYRHEFARRRNDIATESRELLELFFGPQGWKETVVGADGTLLPDRLIGAFEDNDFQRKKRLKTELKKFVTNRKILPIGQSSKSFFPDPRNCDHKLLWKIWCGLATFEMFALARLEIGQPFLFPVMYVGTAADTALSERLHLEPDSHSMLVDFRVPQGTTEHYFRVWGALARDRSGKQISESKNEFEIQSKRLRAEPLDAFLESYDLSLNLPSGPTDRFNKKLKIYQKRFPVVRNPDEDYVTRQYKEWVERAKEVMKTYEFLI